ncbi:MAG: septum formation initiator family protein [Clostridia bacterium]|jgi:cell division protein FtsB|nr:septum formation initiator family protein [Clostridia bacterium]MBR3593876.1 septum formation initiator family protein [Clostridia bacterium]
MAKRNNSIIRRVLLLVVSVYLLYSLGDLQHQLVNQRRELKSYEEQKNIMSQEIEELENLLKYGTDAEIIEKAARDRLGYVYSDEQIFIDISGS